MIRIFDNDDKSNQIAPIGADFAVQPILNKTSTSMNPSSSAHRTELDGTNLHTSNTSQRREKKTSLNPKIVPQQKITKKKAKPITDSTSKIEDVKILKNKKLEKLPPITK